MNLNTASAASAPSNFAFQSSFPTHIAIIMDGNRRWATERQRQATDGHLSGVERAVDVVRYLARSRLNTLTLFAFAAANWQRSHEEVSGLFDLASSALSRFSPMCLSNGVRVRVIGRRDRLPQGLVRAIETIEQRSRGGRRTLNIALDYDAQAAIASASRNAGGHISQLNRRLMERDGTGPVDLLIRTGRERRLSNFLLWECAYAELHFTDVLWPDFTVSDLEAAVRDYQTRQRRFGA